MLYRYKSKLGGTVYCNSWLWIYVPEDNSLPDMMMGTSDGIKHGQITRQHAADLIRNHRCIKKPVGIASIMKIKCTQTGETNDEREKCLAKNS